MNSRKAEKQYNLRKWAQIIKECKSSGEEVMCQIYIVACGSAWHVGMFSQF